MREKLLQKAIIGTNHPDANMPAEALLKQVGIANFKQRAGFIAAKTSNPLAEPVQSLETQCCDAYTISQFLRLNQSRHYELVKLWVEKFQAAKLHLPDEHLPALLSRRFDVRSGFRHTYAPMMSKKARWLFEASHMQEWDWILDYCEDDTNLGDNPGENPVSWFKKKRAKNPSEAREWFAKNWQDVNYLFQAGMLHAFRQGLSEDDIPFLESLLEIPEDEHMYYLSYDVLRLLSLVNAESMQPKIDNIVEMLHMEATRKGSLLIDFSWSDIFETVPKRRKFGTWAQVAQQCHASELVDFLRLVPLERWHKRWYLGFMGMLKAALKGQYGSIIATAWLKRVVDEKDEALAVELLSHSKRDIGDIAILDDYYHQLMYIVSFERFQTLIDEWLGYE